jgi:hypothetical protein
MIVYFRFYMDARGDLVGPRPSLQRSTFVCPHPVASGVVGNTIALRFTAASESGFESLNYRWLRFSKPTIIAKKA